LREVLEADGKRAAAADYVRYLVLVHGRELGEITGAEIAAGVGVSSALGRRVRQEFDNGKLTVTNEDKRRFESVGLLIQSDSTSTADRNVHAGSGPSPPPRPPVAPPPLRRPLRTLPVALRVAPP